jgi:hypothetical protein
MATVEKVTCHLFFVLCLMQLGASEQHCTMTSCTESDTTHAESPTADRASKHQKVTSAADSMNPLSEAGVLQRVLGYVGPGYWLLISLVSKGWRESYLQVPEQQITEQGAYLQIENTEFMCKPRMTLLKAAVASAAVMQLACDCGPPLDCSRLLFIAGRWGDVATLSAALSVACHRTHTCATVPQEAAAWPSCCG